MLKAGQVVPQQSALLELRNEIPIPVDTSHMEMCEFEFPSNGVYRKVCKRMQSMITTGPFAHDSM